MAETRELTPNLVKSHEVINVTVKDMQERNLGKIEELVLNKQSGQVCYVVLSFGGILGLGDKFFALPWRLFNYDTDNECFVINIPKEKLEQAPGFDKNNWPDMSEMSWSRNIDQYYDM